MDMDTPATLHRRAPCNLPPVGENPMQTLTQAQYNNLLPVPAMRPHLQHVRDADPAHDRFLFWGTAEEWQDAMRRCAYLD